MVFYAFCHQVCENRVDCSLSNSYLSLYLTAYTLKTLIAMIKKEVYLSPQAEVLDLSYADPVCQAVSGGIPDYQQDTYIPDWVF